MKKIALITAAGSGRRMGLNIPKQFLLVNDRSILSYSVEAFNSNPLIDEIIIVTNEEYLQDVKKMSTLYSKIKYVIEGGDTRQQSIFIGLTFLKENDIKDDDIVLIHDGARPIIDNKIIEDNIKACIKYDACETVINATDTIIKSKDKETMDETLNREELFQVQTPQSFRFSLIYEAHEKFKNTSATDDAQLVKKLGKQIHLVNGSKKNIKITTIDDLKYFEALLKD